MDNFLRNIMDLLQPLIDKRISCFSVDDVGDNDYIISIMKFVYNSPMDIDTFAQTKYINWEDIKDEIGMVGNYASETGYCMVLDIFFSTMVRLDLKNVPESIIDEIDCLFLRFRNGDYQ